MGHKQDLNKLLEWANNTNGKVIIIFGDPGVGKTFLANQIYNQLERFKSKKQLSAYKPGTKGWGEGLEEWLLSTIAATFIRDLPRGSSRTDLINSILRLANENSILLLLDNVETLDQEWLKYFVTKWRDGCGDSLLLLTSTINPLSSFSENPKVEVHMLKGLDDDEVIELLDEDFSRQFTDKKELLSAAKKLKNNPQKLLYLKWLNPHSTEELKSLTEQLCCGFDKGKEGANQDSLRFVDAIYKQIDGPITHYLALGRVRSVEFEEGLLIHLWDRLCGETSETYMYVLQQLIEKKLLTSRQQDNHRLLRIHPSVHIRLEKQLEQEIGNLHIANVDYFLSEYYRKEFKKYSAISDVKKLCKNGSTVKKQNTGSEGIETLLGHYCFHVYKADNLNAAFNSILAPDSLKRIHYLGLSLGLRPVLAMLDNYLELSINEVSKELKNCVDLSRQKVLEKQKTELASFAVEVKIELAHCDNDLSKHKECLNNLDLAEKIMKKSKYDPYLFRRQRINYLRGVSYSDLGYSNKCVEAYSKVVEDAFNQKRFDERAILALGYLAFELRFHDMVQAITFGRLSLACANDNGDPSLIAKSKCSLGQTLFFADQVEEAKNLFIDARNKCELKSGSKVDRRELGRILIHLAMVHINQRDFETALDLLMRGEQINNKSGDRRREASAKALRAIAIWRQDLEKEKALGLLQEAIKGHCDIEDWRNLPNELYSYAYMLGYHTRKAADEAAISNKHENEFWAELLQDSSHRISLEFFGNYWQNHFRPRLLE